MKKHKISIALLVLTLSVTHISAQMTQRRPERRKSSSLLAENNSFERQSIALDSAIAKHINDDLDDLPADDFYETWSTKGVNAGRVDVADVPDSVYIDCMGYIPPIEGAITSRFGPRWKKFHYGIDIKLNIGDPVCSAFDGKVRITKYDPGYGSYVVVRHDNGLETVYGHFSKILVETGQVVRAGEIIGLGGTSGRSTGPHLHFETRFLGNPINPESIIDFELGEAKMYKYFMVKAVAFNWSDKYKGNSNSNNRNSNRTSASSKKYHKVKSGENLSVIAKRHGVTVSKICSLNGISKRKAIKAGQRLRYN